MKQQIYIGNIYKVTKEKIYSETVKNIKNYGLEAIICGEDAGCVPSSVQLMDTQYELYKSQVLLVKLSDESDLVSKYAEVLEIKNNKVIFEEKNVIYSTPFCVNFLFVDETSIQPYFSKTKKHLVKKIKR